MDFLPSYREDGEQEEIGYERRCDEVDGDVDFPESAMLAILVDCVASVDEAQRCQSVRNAIPEPARYIDGYVEWKEDNDICSTV